ncbi:MAG: hypothetical protein ACPG5B_02835 [Chitinophagales bacterium]
MHKQQFLDIVKEPQHLQNIDFRQIRELVNDYPYFQTAYIMLAQKAVVTSDTNIQNVLAKSATYAGDRQRLYTCLQEAKSGKSTRVAETRQSQTKVFDKKAIKEAVSEQKDDDETLVMPQKNYVVADDDETAIIEQDSPAIQSVYEKLLQKSKGKFKVEEEEITDAKLFKRKKQGTLEDDTEEVPLDTATIKVKARLAVEQELEEQKEVVEEDKWKKSGDSGRITTAEIEVIKLDVLDDLAKMKNEIEWDTTSHTNDLELDFEDKSLDEDNDLLKNLKDKVDAYKKRKQSNNVDDWLSKTTGKKKKIEKSKKKAPLTDDDVKEIKKAVTKSKTPRKDTKMTIEEQVNSSLKESSPIISETMAKVYAKQGHYQKAIKIYKQLSLKYPEKKLTFADKILELKKKL